MTEVQRLAQYVAERKYSELSDAAKKALKIRLLDALGCGIGAMEGEPVKMLAENIEEFGGNALATLIGGGKTAPDRAAFYNSFLMRYLDYNDSYLAKNETCHPSDNIGSILAAGEYADIDGETFLIALAIAYHVQCRLSDEAPVRDKGFDHTVQGAYGSSAGISYALGLDESRIAHAIAISATAYNALRVTRTGNLSHWKGMAFPSTGWTSTHSAFLAMRGITGPEEVIEGNKGFKDTIAGDFSIDWKAENMERVTETIVKKYNAEIHSQATLEGVQEMRELYDIDPENIERIVLNTFDVAYNIIGGGEEGDKKHISTKEEADHSLPYLIAVMLLDGKVLPAQYLRKRINSDDVQTLLQKVEVYEKGDYSDRFPREMPCDLTIYMKNGEKYQIEKTDYEGFNTRPASWDMVINKFKALSSAYADEDRQNRIIEIVQNMEMYSVRDLMKVLNGIKVEKEDLITQN